MKWCWRRRLFAIGTFSVLLAAACSDGSGEDDGAFPTEDGGASADGSSEASAVPSDAGADATAAKTDAGADVDADAAAPTCTAEGWCHSALPKKELMLRDVWGDGKGVVWAVSEGGEVLRWDGSAWAIVFTAPSALYAVWGSGPTDLWLGGAGGLFHGTGAASTAITFEAVALEAAVYSIWGDAANDVWAAGYAPNVNWTYDTGRVYHFTGATDAASSGWASDPVSTTYPQLFSKVWGTAGGDVWLGGESRRGSRALHRVPDGEGGFTWTDIGTTPDGYGLFRAGFSVSKSLVYVAGFGAPGTYHIGTSSDDGATFAWNEGGGSPTKAGLAFTGVWASSPSDVWLAGIFGRLHHWNGTTWKPASIALTNVFPVTQDFTAIWGSGPDDIWVVGQDIALHKRPTP